MMNKYPIIVKIRSPRRKSDQRGIALLLTLLVTIILTVVVLEFNYLIRVHATLSGYLVDDLRAEAAARDGVEMAKAALLNDALADSKKGLTSDSLDEEWAAEITTETGPAKVEATVSDEMAKLNLNRLMNRAVKETDIESENTEMIATVRRLFESLELDPNLVDAIVDWIDKNDEEKPFGAENSYYESQEVPFKCKNGPLDSVEELLLIKGFEKKFLYGDEETPGLIDFVTVCGDEKGRVNINTADEMVLAAVLNNDSLASLIVGEREKAPFLTAEDIATRVPDVDLLKKFTFGSSLFMVSSTGQLASEDPPGRKVTIKALLKRERPQETADNEYLSIDTAFWKVER